MPHDYVLDSTSIDFADVGAALAAATATSSGHRLKSCGPNVLYSYIREEGWNQIEEYVQYQDDLWDDPLPSMNDSSIVDAMKPTFRGRLKRACNQISYLKKPTREVGLEYPYLICDYCGGSHETEKCKQNNPTEQVCLFERDIYDDLSLLRFYQNDNVPSWGNCKKRDDRPEWVVRSKFEDELANLMLEKKFHMKGI
uniref:MAK10-like protein n=1 Tax=Tanacetum cinerariifolium TaxID=118510 RepID=A0A699HLY8_TANCI|nr:hypothetical protein [Tanacetum cinerariifolium]